MLGLSREMTLNLKKHERGWINPNIIEYVNLGFDLGEL
jgi:hypothetical protein